MHNTVVVILYIIILLILLAPALLVISLRVGPHNEFKTNNVDINSNAKHAQYRVFDN